MDRNFSFNTKHLMPSQAYHNKLMKEIDEAYWLGNDDVAKTLEPQADDVKRYVDAGHTFYPTF